MRDDIPNTEWNKYLEGFSERNRTRRTRLEVIGGTGQVESDFWLEDGIPLAGVTLEAWAYEGPRIQIMLDAETARSATHMTHTVSAVRRVGRELNDGGGEVALELEDKEGATTILRFEK
jgi:hypothetical protein